MVGEKLEEVHRARSIIERDSLMSFLKSAGIDSFTGERDMIVNLTDHVNLGLEGYSALFEGYRIYVQAMNVETAKSLIRQQNLIANNTTYEKTSDNPEIEKFFSSSFFSLLLPGIMNITALYWVVRGLQKGQKLTPAKWIISILIWLSTAWFCFWAIKSQIR